MFSAHWKKWFHLQHHQSIWCFIGLYYVWWFKDYLALLLPYCFIPKWSVYFFYDYKKTCPVSYKGSLIERYFIWRAWERRQCWLKDALFFFSKDLFFWFCQVLSHWRYILCLALEAVCEQSKQTNKQIWKQIKQKLTIKSLSWAGLTKRVQAAAIYTTSPPVSAQPEHCLMWLVSVNRTLTTTTLGGGRKKKKCYFSPFLPLATSIIWELCECTCENSILLAGLTPADFEWGVQDLGKAQMTHCTGGWKGTNKNNEHGREAVTHSAYSSGVQMIDWH